MKLDNEQDRQVLLNLIQTAQISGAAVLVVADLVRRIQVAEVNDGVDDGAERDAGPQGPRAS